MMATRRLGRTHHEFRFGRRELVVLGAVFCLIASLVFAAGIVVGREMARGKGAARADATREHRLPEPEGLRGGEAPVKTAATRAEEKVTFYRTLTAPTQDLPQVGKPTIEERLVPRGADDSGGRPRRSPPGRAGASPGRTGGPAARTGGSASRAGAPHAEGRGGGAGPAARASRARPRGDPGAAGADPGSRRRPRPRSRRRGRCR